MKKVEIFDHPRRRKIHKRPIPSFGGISIFFGVSFAIVFAAIKFANAEVLFMLLAISVVVCIGIIDDRFDISPYQKIFFQMVASILIVHNFPQTVLDIMPTINSYIDFPYELGYIFSVMFLIGVMNSVNLIDGADGLCGSICSLILALYSVVFALQSVQYHPFAYVAIGGLGATLGFLKYNFYPGKIFMGDTGSLLLGLVIGTLSLIFFNNLAQDFKEGSNVTIQSPYSLLICILIVPLFDTARVIIIRLMNNSSPFKPDKRHLHHLLMRCGLSHGKIAVIMLVFNVYFLILGLVLDPLGDKFALLIVILNLIVFDQLARKYYAIKLNRGNK